MYVTPQIIGLNESQDMIDAWWEALVVTPEAFSRFACTDGRMYGVRTAADTCVQDLNACVRSAFFRALVDVNRRILNFLNYYPGQQHHVELVPYKPIMALRWPFLKRVGERVTWMPISTLTDVPVSPFVEELLPTTPYSTYNVAETSAAYGPPSSLIYRHPTSLRVVEPSLDSGFPRRIADKWEMPFGTDYTELTIQHKNMTYVDALGVTIDEDVHPFYHNTNQRIPFVHKTPVDGGVRFWFYFWNLTDHTFFDDGADYVQAEFYKLVPSIDFKRRVLDGRVPLELHFYDECGQLTTAESECVEIVSHEDSLIRLRMACAKRTPKYVRVHYVTDSADYGYDAQQAALVRAVSHLVAADLPLSICGCDVKDGFIKMAQRAYTDIRINPVTGDMVEKLTHGNLYGHLVYQEVLNTLKRYVKVRKI
jgi:hypothetical protein